MSGLIGMQKKYLAPLMRNYDQVNTLETTIKAYKEILQNLSESAKSSMYSSDFMKTYVDSLLGIQTVLQEGYETAAKNQINSPELVESLRVASESAKAFNERVEVSGEKEKVRVPKKVEV